jgi:tetratricopeptide (TPR) repeat protein
VSNRTVLLIAVSVLVIVCLLMVAGAALLIRKARPTSGLAAMRKMREAPAEVQSLLDEGQYKVGISGKSRDGTPTHTRGMIAAVYAPEPVKPGEDALAEAAASEAENLLLSISGLPHTFYIGAVREFVGDYDPLGARLSLTRQQGLVAARALGCDALVCIQVMHESGGVEGRLQLIDMAGETEVLSRQVGAGSDQGLVEALPAALKEVLQAAQVPLSARDQRVLAKPPYSAQDYLRAGRIAARWSSRECVREIQQLRRDHPDTPAARTILYGWDTLEWPAAKRAEWLAGWLTEAKRQCPAELLVAASRYLRLEQYEGLDAALAEYEGVKPRNLAGRELRVSRLCAAKQFDSAVRTGREIAEENPRCARGWSALGRAYMQKAIAARGGQYPGPIAPASAPAFSVGMGLARPCLERAAQLAPTAASPIADLIDVRRETRSFGEARQAFEECEALRPGYPNAYAAMLWTYSAGYYPNYWAYTDLLNRAAGAQPRCVWDEMGLAWMLGQQGRAEDAVRHYQRAGEMAPDYFPAGWGTIADGLMDLSFGGPNARSKDAAAIAFARECLDRAARDCSSRRAREDSARLLIRCGKYAEAERALLKLLAEDPKSTDTHRLLADTQRDLGKWREAEANYRAAQPTDAQSDEAKWLWTETFQCMALDGRGEAAAKEIADFDNTHATSQQPGGLPYVATWYLAALQVDKAEAAYRRIPPTERVSATADKIGLCRMQRGDWQGALEQFQAGAKLAEPTEVEPILGQAVCHFKLGAKQEARQLYNRAEQTNFRWLSARALREQVWPPKAIAAFLELEAARKAAP